MGVSICLSMIVKDEAHVVAESLTCVAPYIDTWVVVDTGSSDDTIEIIRTFFAARGIPGEVHERPWSNFGVNRSEALDLCQGRADYIWVMDADDLVVGALDFTNLKLDSYLLRYGSSFRYWRKQVFRSGLKWKYEGVIHEYAVCLDEGTTEARLEGDYHIESRRLGNRNLAPDKYQRDAEILLDVLSAKPDDARATFYLAQSYYDAGEHGLALKYYGRRSEMGGFGEEVFFSLFRCGECLELLEEPWERSLDAYLRAWQSRPGRAEPLHRIARHYRRAEQYHLALLFADRASQIPFPDGDVLFIAASIYEWEIDDELSIVAYYARDYRRSFDVATRLLEVRSVPEPDRERVLANRDFAAHFVRDDFVFYPESIIAELRAASEQPNDRP
ncbi:MAG: glycosyltransferase, partial [Acidobacteriota bacterium]